MADIELVIKIPKEVKIAFDCAESNDLKGCYYDHGGIIGNAIKYGTPLPKHHGRLIDADRVIDEMKAVALDLVKKGYRVNCKGWEGIRENKLTIEKVPEEDDET